MLDKYTARDWYNARADFERDYLTAIVVQERGNMSAVAKRLTIDRGSLYRKMDKLGLRPPVILADAGIPYKENPARRPNRPPRVRKGRWQKMKLTPKVAA